MKAGITASRSGRISLSALAMTQAWHPAHILETRFRKASSQSIRQHHTHCCLILIWARAMAPVLTELYCSPCCLAWTERFIRRSELTKPSGATTARGSLAVRTAKRMSLQGSAVRRKARSSGSTSSPRISSGASVQSTRIMSGSRLARRRLHSQMYLCSSPGSKAKATLPVPTGSA